MSRGAAMPVSRPRFTPKPGCSRLRRRDGPASSTWPTTTTAAPTVGSITRYAVTSTPESLPARARCSAYGPTSALAHAADIGRTWSPWTAFRQGRPTASPASCWRTARRNGKNTCSTPSGACRMPGRWGNWPTLPYAKRCLHTKDYEGPVMLTL